MLFSFYGCGEILLMVECEYEHIGNKLIILVPFRIGLGLKYHHYFSSKFKKDQNINRLCRNINLIEISEMDDSSKKETYPVKYIEPGVVKSFYKGDISGWIGEFLISKITLFEEERMAF